MRNKEPEVSGSPLPSGTARIPWHASHHDASIGTSRSASRGQTAAPGRRFCARGSARRRARAHMLTRARKNPPPPPPHRSSHDGLDCRQAVNQVATLDWEHRAAAETAIVPGRPSPSPSPARSRPPTPTTTHNHNHNAHAHTDASVGATAGADKREREHTHTHIHTRHIHGARADGAHGAVPVISLA